MPREAPVAASADDDADAEIRGSLHGLSMLTFATPEGHKGHRKARALDAYLLPVRERARGALRDEPQQGATSPAAIDAIGECWRLVDEAALVIDRAHWFTPASATTRMWAEHHVRASVVAFKRQAKQLRRPPRGD